MLRRFALLVLGALLAAALVVGLGGRWRGVPPLGTLLDPADGLYRNARRAAAYPERATLVLEGLASPVTVVRDRRGVPHIFAESHVDATAALGYVVAQDRLFQLDFIPRVAAGRLAAAFGPSSVATDRFLRATGMDWGAKKNLRRIREEEGTEWELLRAYTRGVNAYLDRHGAPEDLPLEFRLLGYRPARWSPLQTLRVLQYMTFDLTYRTDAANYATLRRRLGPRAYRQLYPQYARGLFSPMVPPGAPEAATNQAGQEGPPATRSKGQHPPRRGATPPAISSSRAPFFARAQSVLEAEDALRGALRGTPMHGFTPGKGSNNWAVDGSRSATGRPVLANDMHLSLSLPAAFYEAHLVTPEANAYGATIPGTPTLVAAYNERVAWGFTNTASDQIDHYALDLVEDGNAYRFEGEVRPLRAVVDTIAVNGAAPVRDTLYYSHHGPVLREQGAGNAFGAVALRWVAHQPSHTLQALYRMAHAKDAGALREALRDWDTPMQNVIYADSSEIGIVSAGVLPVRAGGASGAGLLDGTTDAHAWTGRAPFDALPQARAPQRGYLFSANQQPTDSSYAPYLGHDWRTGYRSLRIDSLLSAKRRHSARDLRRYQADVRVGQHAAFTFQLDTLAVDSLSPRAERLRRRLREWNGHAARPARHAVSFDAFYRALRALAWDERVFAGDVPRPDDAVLHELATQAPQSRWLDVQATPGRREGAAALFRAALEAAADTLANRYGAGPRPQWGERHKVLFRHLTQNEALDVLSRGPVSYPGYAETLSPARGDTATHSAAWRMVVDFSGERPAGQGIYPGGQSGSPFSPLYDLHLKSYVNFRYYDLQKPQRPEALEGHALTRLTLHPSPDE